MTHRRELFIWQTFHHQTSEHEGLAVAAVTKRSAAVAKWRSWCPRMFFPPQFHFNNIVKMASGLLGVLHQRHFVSTTLSPSISILYMTSFSESLTVPQWLRLPTRWRQNIRRRVEWRPGPKLFLRKSPSVITGMSMEDRYFSPIPSAREGFMAMVSAVCVCVCVCWHCHWKMSLGLINKKCCILVASSGSTSDTLCSKTN